MQKCLRNHQVVFKGPHAEEKHFTCYLLLEVQKQNSNILSFLCRALCEESSYQNKVLPGPKGFKIYKPSPCGVLLGVFAS